MFIINTLISVLLHFFSSVADHNVLTVSCYQSYMKPNGIHEQMYLAIRHKKVGIILFYSVVESEFLNFSILAHHEALII